MAEISPNSRDLMPKGAKVWRKSEGGNWAKIHFAIEGWFSKR